MVKIGVKNSVKILFNKIIRFLRTESSQDALRNILIILIPSILVYYLVDMQTATAFSVGILLASLTDIPGNKIDKLTTAAYCIPLFFLTVFSFSYLLFFNSWTIILLLGVVGFLYTLLGVFGFRINVIGNLGLVVASFTIGLRPSDPIQFSLALTCGAILFFTISVAHVYIFPNRALRYAFKAGAKSLSDLIKLKINCYNPEVSLQESYKSLNSIHIDVSNQLDAIRSMLLRDKRLLSVHDNSTKKWLGKLYLLVDLYELLMAVDHDYKYIRDTLQHGRALHLIRQSLAILSFEIERLTFSNSSEQHGHFDRERISTLINQLENKRKYAPKEQQELLFSIGLHFNKIIEILIKFSKKDIDQHKVHSESINLKNFVPTKINFKTLNKSLNFSSPIFAFAVRISLLLMVAGLLGYLLPQFRYASWMILTIILVAKPSYKVTKKRNYQRLVGSVLGIIISLILLLIIKNGGVLLTIAALCLYLFLAFNKPDYLTCVIFITITILLTQHLYEGEIQNILSSRFVFTILGAIFAILGSLLIPINYYHTIGQATDLLITHFNLFIVEIKTSYVNKNQMFNDLRLTRKITQASLAHCYDALEQFEKEPGTGKYHKTEIHQFQTLAYQINALLVGLTVNITKLDGPQNAGFLHEKINHVQYLIQELQLISGELPSANQR